MDKRYKTRDTIVNLNLAIRRPAARRQTPSPMLGDNITVVLLTVLPTAAFTVLLNAFLSQWILQWRLRHIPIANKKPGEWFDQKATERAQTHAMDIINEAFVKVRILTFDCGCKRQSA